MVCSKESVCFLFWLVGNGAYRTKRDGISAFVEAKRVGLDAGTVFLLRKQEREKVRCPLGAPACVSFFRAGDGCGAASGPGTTPQKVSTSAGSRLPVAASDRSMSMHAACGMADR